MDAKKTERKGKFIPGTEDEKQFDEVLSALLKWIDTSQVDMDVDLDGDVDISLPSKPEELLNSLSIGNLPAEDAVGIVEYEIPALLSAGLSDSPRQWLTRSLPDKILQNIDVMTKRCEKVVRALGSEELKQRLLLRKGTNAYVVENISCRQKTR